MIAKSYIKVLTLLFFTVISYRSIAQITVEDSITVQQILETLQGEGVIISNLTVDAPLTPDTFLNIPTSPAYGIFNDQFGALGMNRGIIMTNGSAVGAVGPNDQSAVSQNNHDSAYYDANLQSLIDTNLLDVELRDACVIEFDIQIASNLLVFNYIFASEEYPEFLGFNDVFGFFISGPGITDTINIATVPGTNIPVSVGEINHLEFAQYYVNNGNGSTPFDNPDLQYDGYTTTLQARADVIPCMTYHIKLAIADASDNSVDSGVFLEENSFSSGITPKLTVKYEYEKFDRAIEGCNNAYVIVRRNRFNEDQNNRQVYKYKISGSAQNGIDYTQITDSIVLEVGEVVDSILIEPLVDGIFDDNENVILTFFSGCTDSILDNSVIVPIHEYYNHPLDSVFRCNSSPVILNLPPSITDSLYWLPSEYLSCSACQSPIANNSVDTLYWFYGTDRVSGCQSYDSVYVQAFDVSADFSFHFEQCYTNVDVFFDNLSTKADTFYWDFGDGEESIEKHPNHTFYAAVNQMEPQDFDIRLIAQNLEFGCRDTIFQSITISNPMVLPNIITPNGDGENDIFTLNGVNHGCWNIFITNRWGKIVFQQDGFKNNFNADQLVDGVYYYYLKNTPEDREFKGYFTVVR